MPFSVKYVTAALESARDAIATAQSGGRNDVLNAESFGIGQLVGAGALEYAEAEAALLAAAADNGMKRPEALPTIRSGLRAGMRQPRETDGEDIRKRPPVTPPNDDAERYARYATQLYRDAVPMAGTIVERYLREARGIPLTDLPPNIRCHPGVKNSGDECYYPAMIAPIVNTGAEGTRITAVHVTWVDPQTAKKTGSPAKKMYGTCKGGAIWLSEYASHMLLAEGIEKTLFCMEASDVPGVVGLSATLLPSIVWPRATQKVTICADPNGAGERAINRAASAWTNDGIEVFCCLPPEPGKDWDECEPEAVAAAIAAARAWRAPVVPSMPDKAPQDTSVINVVTIPDEIEDFERDENGKLYKNEHNICLALKTSGVTFGYDEFACEYRVDGLEGYASEMSDEAVDELYLLLQREYKLKPAFEDFRRVIRSAGRRQRYHPVRQYLDRLDWDGVERLDEWLAAYAGAPDTPLVRAQGRIMLMAAVRRIRQPGCKFDEMIIFESPEGKNKSSALRVLAVNDEWFTDEVPLQANPREVIERLRGCWIVEYGELKGMRSVEVEILKAFLSRTKEVATLKFERETTKFPRQCIFVGTTNDSGYLYSTTGNRRFWPVPIKQFDLENLERDRDQLWAEAAFYEAQGESIRLDQALWDAAREMQLQREEADEWFNLVADWLDKELRDSRTIIEPDGPRLTAADIAKGALGIDPLHLDALKQKRLVRCLKRCGWAPVKKSNGRRYWSPEVGSNAGA